ncbi:alpha-acetolactate decarboxylase [Cladorrhinum sp. PSN259]|nr:alpha-acetolactate decarboxylase [Cladorrhinum sp. PSN259]
MANNELFQYSLVSALMDGVASNGIPISHLLEHGDHGLGTFLNMNGEMIVVDGEVYQMKGDGSVVHVSEPTTTLTPFAAITRFHPTATQKTTISGKADLQKILTSLFPASKNHFLAIKMEGIFKTIDFRTAGGQCFPREGMVDVCSRQSTYAFSGEKGTVFGFRCPEYVMGINVAGDHLHFITEDRQRGGHILAFETEGEVELSVAQMSNFHVELPTDDDEFNEAALVKDEQGIKDVEG